MNRILRDATAVAERVEPPSVGAHVLALLDGNFSQGLAGFSEDIVWHVPGNGNLAGDHRGREAVLALIGRLLGPSYGHDKIVFRSLNEHNGYFFEWVEIRSGSESGSSGHPIVSRAAGGRIREVWWFGEIDNR